MRKNLAHWVAAGVLGGGDPYGGYDWYVNSVTGSDSNAGTSSFSPFATITKLLTVMQAGDSVGLAKGSTWREELLFPGNASQAYAYGVGNKPVLDASDIAVKANISKTGGQTNVYQISVTIPTRAGEVNFFNIWEDDVNLTLVASIAACDAAAGSYYIAAYTGSQTLYIHASDSSDVSANAKVYTYSARIASVYGRSYSGCVLQGVRCQKQIGNGGSILLGISSTVTDCDAFWGNKHNIYVMDGSTLTNVLAKDFYFNSSASLFVHNQDTPAGLGVTYTNCTAQLTAYQAIVTQVGFYGHQNTSGTFGTVTYTGCAVINCNVGFDFEEATAGVLTNPTLTGVNIGIRSYSVPLTITNITWNTGNGVNQFGVIAQAGTPAISVNGLTMATADINTLLFIYSTVANVYTVQNCNFTHAGTTGVCRSIYMTSAGAKLIADHNTYPASGWQTTYFTSALPNDADHFVSDFNSFGDDSQDLRVGGVTYSSVAAYKLATGQDANSTVP